MVEQKKRSTSDKVILGSLVVGYALLIAVNLMFWVPYFMTMDEAGGSPVFLLAFSAFTLGIPLSVRVARCVPRFERVWISIAFLATVAALMVVDIQYSGDPAWSLGFGLLGTSVLLGIATRAHAKPAIVLCVLQMTMALVLPRVPWSADKAFILRARTLTNVGDIDELMPEARVRYHINWCELAREPFGPALVNLYHRNDGSIVRMARR